MSVQGDDLLDLVHNVMGVVHEGTPPSFSRSLMFCLRTEKA